MVQFSKKEAETLTAIIDFYVLRLADNDLEIKMLKRIRHRLSCCIGQGGATNGNGKNFIVRE